jgi:hypothetical protein
MANLLTGDYGAVLQVSEATINRLLASMHQNAWEVISTPSFPHSVGLRLGDDGPIDGVRGTAWAQVGVPRMHLIDGSTDSFNIEVGLRIRYRPDDGTTPLPTYSVGTLRATYRITDISPTCFGWGRLASEYMWLSVVDGSVSFDGSYADDELTVAGFVDEATANQRLSTQLGYLLAKKFAAAPQRMSGRFRQHLFKSLLEPDGSISEAPIVPIPDVPVGGRAVVIPIDLAGGEPSPASINSVQHSLLRGRDFGAAVSQEAIMAVVQPAVDQLRGYTSATTVSWTIGVEPFAWTDSTVYHASIDQASAQWIPQGATAMIQLSAAGHAHTESVLPDFDFNLNYSLHLAFDPAGEQLLLSAGGVYVHVVGHVALPDGVWDALAQNIANTVQQYATAAVSDPGVVSWLTSFSSYSAEVRAQLAKLDNMANAHFDEASFYLSGIVFRGWISTTGRWPVVVQFDKVDDDTISALHTWIPGGRIDHLAWTWGWPPHGGEPGGVAYDDRFVLRRPPTFGRFGPRLGGTPIPGLDGDGEVCLAIRGVFVNPVTGELDPLSWDPICRHFGFRIPRRPDGPRLLARNYARAHDPGQPRPPGPVEAGLQEVTQVGPTSANTLVVFVHDRWTDDDARTLVDGVARCTRQDAGLLVALVLPDGALDPSAETSRDDPRAIAERLEAPLVVTEDVHDSWSQALVVDGDGEGPSWRLLSPDGGLLWKEDERIDAGELARVLDGCLYPSPRATTSGVRVNVELGPGALAAILGVGHRHRPGSEASPCPPFAGVHPADMRSIVSSVSFVRRDAASSMSEIDRLRAANEGRGALDPGVLLVVDGATDDDVHELSEWLGPAFMVVGDPDGSVAAGAGVGAWPTTISIGDGRGGQG